VTSPKPVLRVGAPVIVLGAVSNGSDTHPGIVTRVWSETCANLTVFPDAASPVLMSSMTVYGTEEAAKADLMAHRANGAPRAVAYLQEPLCTSSPD
jgi:hypothetical protein